jgi:hypothetical protein
MAGGRIYTDIVTVGSIEIYQVSSDPNGVLSARRGSLAVDNSVSPKVWQNTDGATSWQDVSSSTTVLSINSSTILAPGTNYVVLVDASGGPVTVTLPLAALMNGRSVTVKKIDTSANLVTVAAPGGNTVEAIASITLGAGSFREGVELVNDGATAWWIATNYAATAGPGTAQSILLFGANSVGASTTTRYLYPSYDDRLAQTIAVQFTAPFAGTLSALYMRQNVPSGNGNSIVYTVRVNGVPTLLAVALASTGTTGSNLVNAVAVAQGDVIDIEVTKAAGVASSPSDIAGSLKLVA